MACLKTVAADLLVQKTVEQREDIDWRRVGVFGAFGLVAMGFLQYAFYVKTLNRLLPNVEAFTALSFRAKLRDKAGLRHLLYQAAIDNFIYTPFFFFPIFYWTQEVFMTPQDERDASGQGIMESALSKYGKNAVEDNVVGLKIWIPADLILFGFFPLYLRVPMMSLVSFGYIVVLSLMRGASVEPSEEGRLYANFDDSNLIDLLQNELKTLATLHERYVSSAEFAELMKSIGITNNDVVSSLFAAVNPDPTQVTIADIATFLFTISQTGSAAYR